MQSYNEKLKKLEMKCPNDITEPVLSFCKNISNESPFFITPTPLNWCLPNECIKNAYLYNTTFGGKFITGWAIWKNELIIEGEFHVIVVTTDGNYLDITPNTSDKVLFLPDYKIKFNGTSIDNIRKPLIDNALVNEFIKKAEERAQLLMPYGKLDSSNELKFKKIQEEIAELSRAILNILD